MSLKKLQLKPDSKSSFPTKKIKDRYVSLPRQICRSFEKTERWMLSFLFNSVLWFFLPFNLLFHQVTNASIALLVSVRWFRPSFRYCTFCIRCYTQNHYSLNLDRSTDSKSWSLGQMQRLCNFLKWRIKFKYNFVLNKIDQDSLQSFFGVTKVCTWSGFCGYK